MEVTPEVMVGALGLATAIVTSLSSRRSSRKAREASERVHAEVATGNGRTAGQYLTDLAAQVGGLRALLETHTLLDETRFTQLQATLDRMEGYSHDRWHDNDNARNLNREMIRRLYAEMGVDWPLPE